MLGEETNGYQMSAWIGTVSCGQMRKLWKTCPNSFPHHGAISGDLWIPVTPSRVASLNAHEVSVAKRVSQEMGVTWMQCVCKQLAIQG